MKPPLCVVDRWQLDSKVVLLSPGQARLVNKMLGSDYFTKNFQVKENKMKIFKLKKSIHPRFFHLLFRG